MQRQKGAAIAQAWAWKTQKANCHVKNVKGVLSRHLLGTRQSLCLSCRDENIKKLMEKRNSKLIWLQMNLASMPKVHGNCAQIAK